MTTTNQLNCLLKYIDSKVMFKELSRGSTVKLCAQDIELLRERCGFRNEQEIAFYIQALESKEFVKSHVLKDCTIPDVSITIDGYIELDMINNPSSSPLSGRTVRGS